MNLTPYQHPLTESEKAALNLINPENESYFFLHKDYKHRNPKKRKPFAYILMSNQITVERFNSERGLFPGAIQVTQGEFDELLEKYPGLQVIFVGDQEIIDEHFKGSKP